MSASINEAPNETKPSKKIRKSIQDFEIGSTTRRIFDDGKYYIARVMTEPQRIFDEEKGKNVMARLIKYYADDQEEWADEDQLNDWEYIPPTIGTKEDAIAIDGSDEDEKDDKDWCHEEYAKNDDDKDDNDNDNDEDWCYIKKSKNSSRKDLPSRKRRGPRSSRKKQNQVWKNSSVAITPSPPRDTLITKQPLTPQDRLEPAAQSNDSLSESPITNFLTNNGSDDSDDDDDDDDDSHGKQSGKKTAPWCFRRSKRARRQTETFLAASRKPPPDPTTDSSGRANPGVVKRSKKEIRRFLLFKMGITEEEIDFALEKMSPPYGQNQAIHIIQQRRDELGNMNRKEAENTTEKFHPEIGLRVRVPMGGSFYHGTVTHGPEWKSPENSTTEVKMWTVTFDDDGDMEDYEWHELLQYRASRPIVKFPNCRGRTLNALELFSGEGIVTQAFCERRFNVRSIDVDPKSYAMTVFDIRKAKYEDIGFVPDFIWASPPCTTCSLLAGAKHRNISAGEFEKTQEAHDHNVLFAQMVCIMKWAKAKNPHLIVVIENPRAQMQNMPMMIEFERTFGLHKATVDYCAFDRDDKKPTNLWTNDFDLFSRLSQFRCSEGRCPYYGGIHPIGVRSHKCFNPSAIPELLAEEVAHYVDSKFYTNRISLTPKVILTNEEITDFNNRLSCQADEN